MSAAASRPAPTPAEVWEALIRPRIDAGRLCERWARTDFRIAWRAQGRPDPLALLEQLAARWQWPQRRAWAAIRAEVARLHQTGATA